MKMYRELEDIIEELEPDIPQVKSSVSGFKFGDIVRSNQSLDDILKVLDKSLVEK